MSTFSVQVNFSKHELPSLFLKNLNEIIANTFKQSVDTVCGGISENTHLILNGSVKPAVFLVIQSICDMDQDINDQCSEALSNYIKNTSSVPLDRIIISYTAKVVSDFAISGRTMHRIEYK